MRQSHLNPQDKIILKIYHKKAFEFSNFWTFGFFSNLYIQQRALKSSCFYSLMRSSVWIYDAASWCNDFLFSNFIILKYLFNLFPKSYIFFQNNVLHLLHHAFRTTLSCDLTKITSLTELIFWVNILWKVINNEMSQTKKTKFTFSRSIYFHFRKTNQENASIFFDEDEGKV